MTQKQKDSQRPDPSGFSKVAARRQNQPRDVPANLKPNDDTEETSVLSQGTVKSTSSSQKEELENLRRAFATMQVEKQRLEQENKDLKAISSGVNSPFGHTANPTTTFQNNNVVTGQKTTTFASPASSTFPQGFTTPADQHTNSVPPTPFTHPPPPGFIWTQFVDTSGTILWKLADSSSPTQGSSNQTTNSNQSRSGLFTAPLGYITFDRKTWNILMKNNVCNSDDLDDVKSWFDDLRSTFFSATQGREIVPELQTLHARYDFANVILPPRHQSNYQSAKNEFDAMSNSLRVLLTRDTTFEKCPNIIDLVTIHKSSACGFEFLMKLLCDIFPHLGGENIDVIDQINDLFISNDDSLSSFLSKTVKLERKLDNTGQTYPPNSIVYKFIKELRRSPSISIAISSIFLAYNEHIEKYGQNTPFPKSPYDIYKFLKMSGVNAHQVIDVKNASDTKILPTTCKAVVNNSVAPSDDDKDTTFLPTTNAAIVSSKKAPLYPPKRDTRNVRKPGNRQDRCKLCQNHHSHLQCPYRGEEWTPIYIRQRVAKHNAMYPDEKPDPQFINQSPPLLAATTKSFAKKADLQQNVEDDDIFVDAVEEITENEEVKNEQGFEPEIKMAEFDYDEYTVTSDGLVKY